MNSCTINSTKSCESQRDTSPRAGNRRGAVVVESAIVISVFLVILLGTLDLGLAVLRYNVLSEAARRMARTASVRGERAAPEHPVWGPNLYNGTAGDGSMYADSIENILVTMHPSDVQIKLEWLDGGNQTGQRVRVRLIMNHDTIIPFLFGAADLQLTARSVMRIEH